MKLQPIIYTTDTAAAVDWYERVLGAPPLHRSDMWSTFDFGEAYLAIHRVPELPEHTRVVISLVAEEPLEDIVTRLAEAGIGPVRGIQDEVFGRSFVLRHPDGSTVQVNEDLRD